VEPQPLGGAQVGERVERVDHPRAHRARARRHAERPPARRAIRRDGVAEGGWIHPPSVVDADGVDQLGAQAKELRGLLNAAVPLGGDVEDQRRPRALEPLAPHVPAVLGGRPLARRRQRDQRGRGGAAGQQPHAAVGGEPDQLHEPAHGGPLDVDGRVVAAGAARVQGRRQEVGEDADGRRRRVHPAEESRVAVAHRVREDGRAEALEDRLGAGAGIAEGLLDERGALVGHHGLEDRPRPNRREIVGHEVDGLVSQPAEVLGIEGGWRGRVEARSRHDRLLPRVRRFGGGAGARCRPSSIAR